MVDFAALPPDVVSGRMYAGSGSGPLAAAAAAWDQLAATLGSAATSYRSVVTGLVDGEWQGPASASMAAAAQPYVEWMNATASQAAQTAGLARVAAAAFEAAHAGVVPPPLIAANRAALSTLVAGNVLGQNSAAIAANQAEYQQMWAQDAAVMHSYAAGSAAAVKPLAGFSPAPQAANPAAAGATAGAQTAAAPQSLTGMLGNLPDVLAPLQGALGNPTLDALNGVFGNFGTLALQSSGPMFFSEMCQFFELPLMTATGKLSVLGPIVAGKAMGAATGAGLASSVSAEGSGLALAGSHEPTGGAAGSAASASAGRAVPVGKLSVPPSWAGAAPEIRLASAAVPVGGSALLPPTGLGMTAGGFGGAPMLAGMVNSPRTGESRVRVGARAAAQHDGAADGEQAADGWGFEAGADEREARELDRLRDQMGDLAMECRAVARLMREAMR